MGRVTDLKLGLIEKEKADIKIFPKDAATFNVII